MTEFNVKRNRPTPDDMSSLAAQSKKHLEDNPLLEALTLVIESNAEYARGVTTILDSDLEREVLLTDIRKEVAETRKIIEHHGLVIDALSLQVKEVKLKLDTLDESISESLQDKFKPLYLAADLQETGAQYNPTDKLVVMFQKVVSNKIFAMVAGIVIWIVVKFIFESGAK